ncbi:MAG: polysaccharide biosynthesis/export family protein [Alphaproteobacteria bacterium]
MPGKFENVFGELLTTVFMRGALGLVILLAMGLSAQANHLPSSYQIRPGDKLTITVLGHHDLSGEVKVGESGRAVLPLVGPVAAGGMTLRQFRDYFTASLNKGYVLSRQVTVDVINYSEIEIIGQVESPGTCAHLEGMTVAVAVETAGGFTKKAYERLVVVVRADDPTRTPIELSLEEQILPGDMIEVVRRMF